MGDSLSLIIDVLRAISSNWLTSERKKPNFLRCRAPSFCLAEDSHGYFAMDARVEVVRLKLPPDLPFCCCVSMRIALAFPSKWRKSSHSPAENCGLNNVSFCTK